MDTGNTTKQLPPEIIYEILSHQFRGLMFNDHPPSSEKLHSNLRIFLRSNATVSKTFYHICRVITYKYMNFTTARCFNKALEVLKHNTTDLCRLIQVADFQELTSIGLGRSGQMNKMIKNLTNETLSEFLHLTKNSLREFLASEHIQGDLDKNVMYQLLCPGSTLNVLDFCGCSGSGFSDIFATVINILCDKTTGEMKEHNYQLTALGLNECTDLPVQPLGKYLRSLPELQMLDLSHTSIDDYTLVNILPHWKNLTHLSLANCSQLTPRAILEFFSYHPAVTDADNSTLQWLNLKAHKHTSSWTEAQTMFLLKKLCRYGHNQSLQYLNIDGLPLHLSEDGTVTKMAYYYQCQDTLTFIKWNFPSLKSLSIRKANVPIPNLVRFLSPNETFETSVFEFSSPAPPVSALTNPLPLRAQKLKFLDIAGNAYVNKWTITDPALFKCSSTLVALEVSFECWQLVESRKDSSLTFMVPVGNFPNSRSSCLPITSGPHCEEVKWTCYIDTSYGRRYWIYKVDDVLNGASLNARGSITRYDIEGNKIIDIVKQPDFLKFAQNKIVLGCGIAPLTSKRQQKIYRYLKPPAPKYFGQDGKPTLTGTRASTIRAPRRPPGVWRIIHNPSENAAIITHADTLQEDQASSTASSSYSASRMQISGRNNNRDGLYWDRSVTDLRQLYFPAEDLQASNSTDSYLTIESPLEESYITYEDLNNPELQRRRSQFNLFRVAENPPTRNSLLTKSLKNNGAPPLAVTHSTHPYSSEDSIDSQPYRKHLCAAEEYEVFGCIERGMYRYYSLRT